MSSKSLQVFLRSRRSVRRFLPQPIPEDVLARVLETATWAPSAHNRQPWRLAVLHSTDVKERLADSMGARFRQDLLSDGISAEEADSQVQRSRQRILGAPVVVVLCLDPDGLDLYPDPRRCQSEHQMAVQSVALCGGTLLLAAHSEGLGGVWVCAPLFAPDTVRSALGLPPAWEPQGMILLGYPASIPEPRPRRPVSEVVVFL